MCLVQPGFLCKFSPSGSHRVFAGHQAALWQLPGTGHVRPFQSQDPTVIAVNDHPNTRPEVFARLIRPGHRFSSNSHARRASLRSSPFVAISFA